MVRTLTRTGKLGHARPYEFVPNKVLSKHIMDEETNVCLTVGLSFRNPRINNKRMSWDDALRWLDKAGSLYVYEACYKDDDDALYVNALSGNDLF